MLINYGEKLGIDLTQFYIYFLVRKLRVNYCVFFSILNCFECCVNKIIFLGYKYINTIHFKAK